VDYVNQIRKYRREPDPASKWSRMPHLIDTDRTEVDTYLKDREAFRVEVRRENESRFPSTGLREKLLARRRH